AADRPADAPAASQPAAVPPSDEPTEKQDAPAAASDKTPAPKAAKAPAEKIEAAPVPAGPTPPAKTAKFVEKFLARHGGSADVVLQPVGRRGVRITLVGADGVLGDTMVDSLSEAEAVRDGISGLTGSDWTRELVSRTDVPAGHWKRMAGSGALV
ncbi:hypothetical protein, partial [Dietzia sp. E1]|uniref:hypothetical protein n=1 Tax=Dietzia sp. E1 TaxID=328361 RepID=UPI0016575709